MTASRLFISHASSDKLFVNKLIKRLEDNGVDSAWYDVRDIDAASNVYAAIDAGIAGCDYFAIVLTAEAATRPWVSYEITKARESNKQVLAIQYASAAEYGQMLVGNPHINQILSGGQQKALNFLDDFDGAFLDLLCKVAPDIGARQLKQHRLRKILEAADPDEAERVMSLVALAPNDYLPDLCKLLPSLRDGRKLRHRVERALCHIGRPAIGPLLRVLTLAIRVPTDAQPAPSHLAGRLDKAGDENVTFAGREALDYLRHIIISGGNRDWAAQQGASFCIGALANYDPDLRAELATELSAWLKSALGEIAALRDDAALNDQGYDCLRMLLDAASQVARDGNIDPWLVKEFTSSELWGPNFEEAMYKLASYIVAFFSKARDPRSLEYLLKCAWISTMVKDYFAGTRAPNPWEDCFIPFGAVAIEPLVECFPKANAGFQSMILQNLAAIPNPRATDWVLDYLIGHADTLRDSFRGELLIRMANSGVPSTAARIVEAYLGDHPALKVVADERDRVDTAAAAACQWTTPQLALRACTALLGNDRHWWVQLRAAKAVGNLGLYALYGTLHDLVRQSNRGELRSRCAYELARHRAIPEAELRTYLGNAVAKGEAPMIAAALSYYDAAEAIPHLVRGLHDSFLDADSHMHDFYADALRRMTLPAAKSQLAKWYSRI